MRAIVNQYYDIQKIRIEAENQVRSIKQEKSEGNVDFIRTSIINKLKVIEKDIIKQSKEALKGYSLYTEWLKDVKGVGPVLAMGLIAYIGDPTRFKDPSHLWAYAGLHVIDGKAAKRAKGQKSNWNTKLKTLCWLVGESFVKQKNSKYRDLYDQLRAFYNEKYPKESKGHQYAMAKRKVVKIFLVHLWSEWCSLEGIKPKKPYVIDRLGHTGYIAP